jgi:hypothetical protein
MRKKSLDRGIVMILVFTLLTTLTWVGLEVYRAYAKIEIPDVNQYLQELNPTLNTRVLEQIESRSP